MFDAESFVRSYLDAVANGDAMAEFDRWYCPGALQVEWPNKLMPDGAIRDLGALAQAGERGTSIVVEQSYEITGIVAAGDRIAAEVVFRARFAIDICDVPAGEVMEARFAMVFEMHQGRILRHASYDCFVPHGSTIGARWQEAVRAQG